MNNKKKEFLSFQDWIAKIYPETVKMKSMNSINRRETALSRTITFQVTDKCNLACTYCYQINKGVRRMSFEVAKLLIDKLLSGEGGVGDYLGISPAIILDFIGGEPFLEVELIDQIVDYFRLRTMELNHPWANKFCISICSNGVLYKDPKVQAFLQKNRDILSFNVTVDGTKKLHDSCRIFPDGSPSYDMAHDAAMDWKRRGNYMGSKITLAPGNIKYFNDCLRQMIADGFDEINANCVYEEGWKDEHATEVYNQCKRFTDWFHNEKEYKNDDIFISFLTEKHGMPMSEEDNNNWCGGTGLMLAVDPDGKLYPCLRYMESSLGDQREPIIIGDVWNGIGSRKCERDCISCMDCVTRRSQSTDECFYCPIANGCSWCSGYNYQSQGSFNKRATYICCMTKARALAINYYWNTYYLMNNIPKVCDLWVPKQWAIPIIGEKEYNHLVNMVKKLGGFVNEDKTEVRGYKPKIME